ncbi:DMT family transporter [candidate division WOR-3 bacterium]|nr:DMT family transporter [candidate division WOR-3 bacterium]
MSQYIGEIAALGTACCWSVGSIFFTISSRQIGHNTVNRLRLVVGLILLMVAHYVLTGSLWPRDITYEHWMWFGLSGIIGFAIGDTLLFRSFVLIGPRLAMLMMALVPVFSTLIAWVFLGEVLALTDIIAIVVTIAGISWVVLSRQKTTNITGQKDHYAIGLLCGIGGALGQAIGLVFSKKGLLTGLPPLSGNIVRIFIATLVIWFIASISKNLPATFRSIRERRAVYAMCGGAFLGPFLGVWLSLIAVDNAYVGIASTLMALPPVFLIPLSYWIFKEKITCGAILGTVVTMIGVALIFLL